MPLWCLILSQEPVPLPEKEPSLQAKVSVHLKIVPVGEAVAALSKAGRVPLETSSTLKNLKATVLVREVPVGRTMARLADVMRCRWERRGPAYRLVRDAEADAREKAFVDAEDASARKKLERRLRDLAEAAGTPYADLLAERKSLQANVGRQPDDAGAQARLSTLASCRSGDDWLCGLALRLAGEDGISRLMAGGTIVGSTTPASGVVALPDLAKGLPRGSEEKPDPTDRVDLFLRFDPDSQTLRTRVGRPGLADDLSSEGMAGPIDATSLAESPFGKELAAWAQDDKSDAAARIACDPSTPERPSDWWSSRWSASDRLEWLHESTGLPIVAMASRSAMPWNALRFKGTVAECLGAWRREPNPGAYRLEGGFLMARPFGFWRLPRYEASESTLRLCESSPEPPLDAYAATAAQMTDAQAEALSWNSMLLRVSFYPFRNVRPLRLWNALESAQKSALMAGGSVSFLSLTPTARRAFSEAVDPFAAGHLSGAIPALLGGGVASPFARWGISGKTEGVTLVPPGMPLDRLNPADGVRPELPAGIELRLGPTTEDAIECRLYLRGPRRGLAFLPGQPAGHAEPKSP